MEATFGGGRTTDAMVTDQRGIGDFMKFKLVPDGLGHYGLQTKSGNYVTAENSGGLTTAVTRDVLHTNATLLQDWERFTLVPQDGSRIFALQARDGHYRRAGRRRPAQRRLQLERDTHSLMGEVPHRVRRLVSRDSVVFTPA